MPTFAEVARSKAESEAAKLHSEAEKAALDVEKARIELAQMAVPDLSGIERGSLTAGEGKALLASPLASRALSRAAEKVANSVAAQATTKVRVTTNRDLEAAAAALAEVQSGLTSLKDLAERAEAEVPAPPEQPEEGTGPGRGLAPWVGAVAASAAKSILVPALSLLSAKRTVSTQELAGDDRLAAIAVAGALKSVTASRVVYLDTARPRLAATSALTVLRNEVSAKATTLRNLKAGLAGREDAPAVLRCEEIDRIVAAIDSFLIALMTVPAGATRSAWTSALVEEMLISEKHDILVVQAISGSSLQLLDDRPLWWKDRFSTYASMGVAFVLVDGSDGQVKLAGSRTATSVMQGKIGADLDARSVRDITL